ncbi:non-specific lipid transfer protein GPI-anchored 9-like [Telopea speciosissima]|uniref:non-specific lipid transfer protein GPI-anchored 9-like n=1 Tax=Telopea speciosissima TaxID=54955 RepID=UPI001CC554A1|nr:non-specific lipid transfer protein GPI-anchored 9-like [Telopea speciosissima]
MESFKFFSSFLILFSSWVFLGFSQGTGGGTSGGDPTACLTKLIPCQDSLKVSSAPPPTCCIPLKAMVTDDPKCLCGLYNDPEMLKNLNITQADLLKLPKGCAIKVDMTVCEKVAPASSPTASPSDSTGTKGNSTGGNSTGSPTSKSSADGIYPFSGLGFIVTFVVLILSAF